MKWPRRFLGVYVVIAIIFVVVRFACRLPAPAGKNPFESLVFAHRGGLPWAEENTLEAVQGAVAQNVPAVEVDVFLSKDNVPVVIHDPTVNRTTNGKGFVKDFTLTELQQLHIRNSEREFLTNHKIPALEDVIKLTQQTKRVLEIEVKPEVENKYRMAKELKILFARYNLYASVFVSSFDPLILYYVRSMDPAIHTALSHKKNATGFKLVDFMLLQPGLAKFLGVSIIEPDRLIADKEYINYWKKRGYGLNIWTVNRQKDKEFFRSMGVSYTTDCPFTDCPNRSDD
jgi:glycerophosphoryl diester phosphodiesterase